MARLATYVHIADQDGVAHAFGPDDTVPDWAVKAITNPNAWADAPADGDSGAKAPTKAEMKAEIERRNADREDDAKIVPASDKNDDLAAALAADDEKSA